MMNGPIQTKTKEFLLLQFHPSPRVPVCVCGALLVWRERSWFSFSTGDRRIDERERKKNFEKSTDLFEMTFACI